MRFLTDGPDIPNELIVEHDKGNVVFFCGAGVSRQNAKLPDFARLLADVLDKLHSAEGSPARIRSRCAKCMPSDAAIDRVFTLLEEEVGVHNVESVVAKTLHPGASPCLRAHEIVRALSRTLGRTKIVTTNFDRLFEDAGQNIETINLANGEVTEEDFDGVVYLHGRVNDSYEKAEGNGFVLSSASYGKAYLADGWATEFIKKLLRDHTIVFVGLSANDPPIRYLLEGLAAHFSSPKRKNLYSFDVGDTETVKQNWEAKGVAAVPCATYDLLWASLSDWADRTRNISDWQNRLLGRARGGPTAFQPHERGQLAQFVSTTNGARIFHEFEPPLPAEWLFVFDSNIRKSSQKYWLDADHSGSFQTITPLWDCFALTQDDRRRFQEADLPNPVYSTEPWLPLRIRMLLFWVAKVSHEPACVQWASGRVLTPWLRNQICYQMRTQSGKYSPAVRRAWCLLLESMGGHPAEDGLIYDFVSDTKSLGWTSERVRQFARITRPRLLPSQTSLNIST